MGDGDANVVEQTPLSVFGERSIVMNDLGGLKSGYLVLICSWKDASWTAKPFRAKRETVAEE